MFKYLIAFIFLANASAFSYDYLQTTREMIRQLDEDMERVDNRNFRKDMKRLMREAGEIMHNASKHSSQDQTCGR